MSARDKATRILLELEAKAERQATADLAASQQALTMAQSGAVIRSPKNHARKVRKYEN